ncbi:cytochrome c3 family protein [Pollutimonas sp. M17]|uniref:cytochrome c3 family protein n=1 Tax=Pollutimonas sp. M17 TaxID=2962065 RepID=UPI0021F4253A|nr:cytochrome c3 family protein [Pollutimonas sp. M17]UYO95421.1 cytochrome c family protein [Pollutimonas sp. M17]HWK70320.1 cytochrome c3 family protein [Burkholderiaceae bacterium]
MPQLLERSQVLLVKLVLLAPVCLLLLTIAGMVWRTTSPAEPAVAVPQPIPFSHKHHVGDDGIDCRYCHTSVETSASAGMPSTGICLTCHSQLFRDAPALAPLHESMRSGKPIQWNRVYDLPDFVFFNHSIHVNKGVACVSCHGRVDQMPVLMRQQALDMQWCLGCHRDPSRRVVPLDHVTAMRTMPVLTKAERDHLLRLLQLEDPQRLTDCSSCHR